ncbi:hypothetical protein ACQZ32_07685 [Ralstonia pseudosolanacearum]|uniref:hypothetical protein n=1 Tax=Ralstonia pseudosolanacearum TaxID=1310165 RepID=UPI0007DB66DF|nr:hypothetical protein [Ralstonia pseudosolanacearum]MDC6292864.1 hypothetical protein [Ralstonia pseudosolanacearum]MDD7790359.1 hypothetical protein [Ralstonia pseudosolanacearum]MDN3366389.1 hypothetical protein [Ralstonia pseudosolanacearum]QOK89715.1 hypothetical protein HF907_24620 [Ralstonia pseudosolanacearum]
MRKISGSSKSHQVTEAQEDTERRPNHKTQNLSVISITAPKSNEELRAKLAQAPRSSPASEKELSVAETLVSMGNNSIRN